MSVYEAILAFIGDIPSGYEELAWVASAIFGIYLVMSFFSVLISVFRLGTGGR